MGSTRGGGSEDGVLAGRVAERDGGALETLYDRYGAACFTLARRIVADDGLAEAVVLDVFGTVWEDAARSERARSGLAGWLLAMTQHRAVELVRREGHRKHRPSPAETIALLSGGAGAAGDEADEPWWRLRRGRVRQALDHLDAADRDLVLLAYFGGYTQREIAGITGVPVATIKSRMHDAVESLRQGLGEQARLAP